MTLQVKYWITKISGVDGRNKTIEIEVPANCILYTETRGVSRTIEAKVRKLLSKEEKKDFWMLNIDEVRTV